MTLLTSWISTPTAFLLLYFLRAKVHASGNPWEEEIDYTYVIIGVTLGAVLAIGFLVVIMCMIKAKMIDSGFGESDGKMDRRSNTGSSQNRDDSNTIRNQSTRDQ